MTTLLLDTHVLYWWSAEASRLSPTASQRIEDADVLAVSAISWFELAWLGQNHRIDVPLPIHSWLEELAAQVQTVPITPAIAATAAGLPDSFPGDPMDCLIYASAIERGILLVTKDERLLSHPSQRQIAFW